MKILKLVEIANLFKKVNNSFLVNQIDLKEDMIKVIFCHSCYASINQVKPKLPNIHKSNGLELEEVPEELKLKDLEQQLIARSLLFMKVKKLPTTRMKAMVDKVISVPIGDSNFLLKLLPLEGNHYLG